MYIIIVLLFQLCSSQWMDQCRGNVMVANQGRIVASEQHTHHYTDTKKIWEHCASCVNTYGARRCSAPTIAVDVTCECHINNPQRCRCKDNLSFVGLIVICVLAPVLLFFVITLMIFLACQKGPRQPTGFGVCSI